VKVRLRNPDRDVEVAGGRRVRDVLADLRMNPDTVLVIRRGALITRDEHVGEQDEIEVRPVISGGAR
jgi:sulfur carrier protein ThiS